MANLSAYTENTETVLKVLVPGGIILVPTRCKFDQALYCYNLITVNIQTRAWPGGAQSACTHTFKIPESALGAYISCDRIRKKASCFHSCV